MDNKFDRFLHRVVRYGIFLIPFIPLLIFRNTFSVFNFGKVIVFRTLIEVLLVAYIPLAIKYPNLRPPRPNFKFPNIIFCALLLFTVSMTISTFLGVNYFKSFWGEWERMGGLFSWVHYLAFFTIVISVFKKREDWLNLMWLSIFAALVSASYGFLQKSDSIDIVGASSTRIRIFGTLGNPASFASYLIFNLFFTGYLFWHGSVGRRGKVFLVGVSLIFISGILLSGVRGAFIAMIFSSCFLIFSYFYHKSRAKAFLFPLVLITSIILVFQLPLLRDNEAIGRLRVLSSNNETIENRLIIWKMGIEGIRDKPLVGWGPENHEAHFSVNYDPAIFRGTGSNVFDRAHNLFVEVGITQGVLGLAALLFIFISVTAVIWKTNIKGRLILSALLIAYIVHNLFFFDLASQYIMLMILFGFVYYSAESNNTSKGIPKKKNGFRKTYYLVPILAILATPVINMANLKPFAANYLSTRGFISFYNAKKYSNDEIRRLSEYNKGVTEFNEALDMAEWSRSDILRKFSENFIEASLFLDRKLPKERLKENTLYLVEQLGIDRERRNLEFSSYIYEYKTMRLLGLYFDAQYFEKVEEKQKEAIIKFPKVVELYYDIADSQDFLKDKQGLIDSLEKAYQINPGVPESSFRLGIGYMKFEKDRREEGADLVYAAIEDGFDLYRHRDLLTRVLIQNKMYDDMIKIFSFLAERHPKYNIELSYAYLLSGDRVKAKEKADEAFSLPLTPSENQTLFEIYRKIN